MDHALISTSGGLLKVDLESGAVVSIHDGKRFYFGITWDADRYHIGCIRDGKPCIVNLNAALEPIGSNDFTFDLPQQASPHALFFSPLLGQYFWALSGFDAIYVSPDAAVWSPWHPTGETLIEWQGRTKGRGPRPFVRMQLGKVLEVREKKWTGVGSQNLHHFNSVFIDRANIYISAHNRGPSEVFVFDHQKNMTNSVRMGNMAHSVWFDDGLFICDSGGKAIRSPSGVVYESPADSFPRGIAFMGGRYYLGLSSITNRAQRARVRAGRRDRNIGRGRIHVLNNRFEFEREIELPNGTGQISETRALCADAKTHNGLEPPQ